MEEFPFVTEVPVRFRDLDAVGHVNNAVYATYLEQARLAFVEERLGSPATELGMVVASLRLDYRRAVPGDAEVVAVGVDVSSVGESSFDLAYAVHHDGSVAATGATTQVRVDPETGASRPLPRSWRSALDGVTGS